MIGIMDFTTLPLVLEGEVEVTAIAQVVQT